MTLLKFLKSKVLLINLLIAGVFLLLLIWGFFRFLDVYTHHGESMTVPDMTGKSVEEVAEIVTERGLRYEITDSGYNANLPVGAVLEHNPSPYSKVKRNRRIYLTINSSEAPKVDVPVLADVSLRQAMLILESRGLKVGELIYEPDIAQNVVLRLEKNGTVLEEGSRIPQNSEVNLVLGDGLAGSEVEIPNLRGLTVREAMFVLNVSGLNLGAAVYDAAVQDSSEALIYSQNPQPNTDVKISHGEAINIFLASPGDYKQRRDRSDQWEEYDPEELEKLQNSESPGTIDF